MRALLALEDGTIFEGYSFGAEGQAVGELVFNTGMAAYQEVLADATNFGQIVVMTYPLIGNSGMPESPSQWPTLSGLVSREVCAPASGAMSVDLYMKSRHIPGLQGIDTRTLTQKLRAMGCSNGMIVSGDDACAAFRFDDYKEYIAAYRIRNAVTAVTGRTVRQCGFPEDVDIPDLPSYSLNITVPDRSIGKGLRLALIDYGACEGILKSLCFRGCCVTVYPAVTAAIEDNPDGIVFSGGPGDPRSFLPKALPLLEATRKIPALGIGLGHQLLALAEGLSIARLPYGHRGSNYPVMDMRSRKTYITGQNHGYVVDTDSVTKEIAEITYTQLNDGSVEGLMYKNRSAVSVQFHPEAGSGPQELARVFDDFIKTVRQTKQANSGSEA